MADHLGYEPHAVEGRNSGNSRNGSYPKTVTTEVGKVRLDVPRDRNASFEPATVPKGQRRLDGLSGNVISLYAKGMTTGDIQAHLAEIYDTEFRLIPSGADSPPLVVPGLGGATIDLAELRGSPVWVNFMATWCPPCRDELPLMNAYAAEHQDDGLVVIAIDAGHGGEDPGALGPGRLREKDVVLAIAKEVHRLFERDAGFKPTLIRSGDYYVSLAGRRDLARKRQADLFVSIHADAFKRKEANGASVYALSTKGATSTAARYLAQRENAADLVGGVSLSDKDDVLAGVLADLSMTSTLDTSLKLGDKVLRNLDNRQLVPVARAFSQFLNLANIADQRHAVSREMEKGYDAATGLSAQSGTYVSEVPRYVVLKFGSSVLRGEEDLPLAVRRFLRDVIAEADEREVMFRGRVTWRDDDVGQCRLRVRLQDEVADVGLDVRHAQRPRRHQGAADRRGRAPSRRRRRADRGQPHAPAGRDRGETRVPAVAVRERGGRGPRSVRRSAAAAVE